MATTDGMRVTVTENGPYRVEGGVPVARQTIVADEAGDSLDWERGEPLETDETYLLCRCGQSANKPFCDDSHLRVGFDGTETASRAPYLELARELDGPELALTDAESYCAGARFCDVAGSVWRLVRSTEPGSADLARREAAMCPSGRLVVWDRATRQPIEPELEPSIGLMEDPVQGVAGPLCVRGGITVVGADGEPYEVRNRVTLCRCGASGNKPFCDGSHSVVGFTD
jgi:CDGSH-type Zn-finger protein